MSDKDDVVYKEEGKGKPPIEKIVEGPTQPEERVQFNDKLEETEEEADEDSDPAFADGMRKKMGEALLQAKMALTEGEVPIGAAVYKDGKLIASAHNRKENDKDPSAHAEILVLREATKAIGDWRLAGCELYVTAEPCPMCLGAIMQTQISTLVYGCDEPTYGAVDSHRLLSLYNNLLNSLQIYGGATRF